MPHLFLLLLFPDFHLEGVQTGYQTHNVKKYTEKRARQKRNINKLHPVMFLRTAEIFNKKRVIIRTLLGPHIQVLSVKIPP